MEKKLTKKPVCGCGLEMVKVHYKGYYDDFDYWNCENIDCLILDEAELKTTTYGSFAAPRNYDKKK